MGQRRRRTVRGPHSRSLRRPLRLEPLEERRLLAITVTTNLDVVDFNDGVLSLREAIFVANTAAGPDTIEFDFGHDGPETIVLTQGQLTITDSLTITGSGADLLTIDASGNDPTPDENNGDGSRVFLIDDGVRDNRFEVELRGLTLTGGDTSDRRGGAIHSREHLTVRESVITGNAVQALPAQAGGWGGGIQTLYANLTVIDSTLTNNVASTSGGAIDFNRLNVGVELTITNSTIEGNFAGEMGGGLLIAGNATITGTTIAGNEAIQEGGGINVWDLADQANVTIVDSQIIGNRAGVGGGIYSSSDVAKFVITDSSISGNEAVSTGGGIQLQRSGALAATAYSLEIRNSAISGNLAASGAGIVAFDPAGGAGTALKIVSSRIAENEFHVSSFGPAGGIEASAIARLVLTDSIIEGNAGNGINARGVGAPYGVLTMERTQVRDNERIGVSARDLTSTLTDSTITGNGGRGLEKQNAQLTVSGGSFTNNGGTGIHSSRETVSIQGATISGNSSDGAGGGVYSRFGNLTIVASTISGNHATHAGGAVFHTSTNSGHSLSIESTTIRDNTANGGGGIDSDRYIRLIDTVVTGNKSTLAGGGIVARNRLVLLRSVVSENETLGPARAGGGILAVGSADLLLIQDSSVSNNVATGSGGGIESIAAVQIRRSNISGNSAFAHGGGIHAPNRNVSILESTVADNRTTGPNARGGGLVGGAVTVTQSTISGNRTEGMISPGGGIIANTLTLEQSTVTNNRALAADGIGGGVNVSGAATLRGSIIANNVAGGSNPDLRVGQIASANYSLIGDTAGLTPVQLNAINFGSGNQLDMDPRLGPLAYNGGPTFADGTRMLTHALLAGSPAIDAGDPAMTGPVAMYRFEEATGAMIADDLVGGNDGTYHGDPVLGQPGAPLAGGAGAEFDGVDDFVTIPRTVADNFTISMWVRTTQSVSGPAGAGLIGGNAEGNSDFQVLLFSGRVALEVGGVPIVAARTINNGNWHHVAVTRNAATGARAVYVDGDQGVVAFGGMTGSLDAATELHVGELLSGMGRFAGAIDELALYDRVLSTAEIEQLAAGSPSLFDQRGEPHLRVLDGDVAEDIAIDIGAYERELGETYNFVVDTVADESDGDYSAGDFSLREAIELSNANPGTDAISFKASLTAAGPATILLTQGELQISDAVAVNGPGANLLTIDAQQQSRVAKIDDPFVTNEDFDVTISGLTFQNGRTTAHNGSGTDRTYNGGAIHSSTSGVLSIQDSVLRENGTQGIRASGGAVFAIGNVAISGTVVEGNTTLGERAYGGGIHAFGSVTITGSVVRRNSTAGSVARGGGVRSNAGIVVEDSVVADNSTSGFSGDGGGLSGGLVTVTRTTVAGNRTTGGIAHGGGIYGLGVELVDSTLSGNTTAGDQAHGGGALSIAGGGITVIRSTVTDNHAQSGTSHGGGLRTIEGNLEIAGSIVAGNSAGGEGPDLRPNGFADFVASYSLIGDTSGLTSEQLAAINSGIGNVLNEDPQLGPLAYNGGPVFADGTRMLTHALLPGSPAIDAGDPAEMAGMNGVPEFDQRGGPWSRVVNGDDVPEARIDMGAVEWQVNPLGGDYNFDGVVDAADYSVWRDTFGSTNDLRADGSSATTPGAPDGVVDEHDYAWWKANFGSVMEQGAGSREPGVGVDQGVVQLNRGSAAVGGVDEFWASEEKITAGEGRRVALLAPIGAPAGSGLQGEGRANTAWQASNGTRAGVVHRDAALLAWATRRGSGEPRVGDAGVVGCEAAVEDYGWESLDEVFATLVCLR